jgi:uncharacterized protein with ATP-grasp and redox domains
VLATFKERVPKIIETILSKNADVLSAHADVVQALSAVRQMLVAGPVARIQPLNVSVYQNANWQAHLLPLIAQGTRMDEIDTFFLENLIYRYVMDAIHYFATLRPALCKRDPFRAHKDEALEGAAAGGFSKVKNVFDTFLSESTDADGSTNNGGALSSASFSSIVKLMLWGNRADLSLTAGEAVHTSSSPTAADSSGAHSSVPDTMLLTDDTNALWQHIDAFDDCGIVLDNCGLELVTDLVFAEMMLSSGCAETFTLYAKSHPVFVSDAIPDDVDRHLAWVQERLGEGCSLADHLKSGKLKVVSDPFFTSGFKYREIASKAPKLAAAFGKHDLLVFKGDANYRRLLGEREWAPTTPFSVVVDYLAGITSTLALRTLKYPLAAGIAADKVSAARDAYGTNEWNCTGQCGVIQFSPKYEGNRK